MKNKKPKSAQPNVAYQLFQNRIFTLLSRNRNLRNKFINVVDAFNYLEWVRDQFGVEKFDDTREIVWSKISEQVDREFEGIEFGVAWGYLTWWWITNHPTQLISWHGFDRFTGLPREWRYLPKGEFDAGGKTPNLKDSRISWHVGDIEKTINHLVLDKNRSYSVLVFFDLDIYEPSLIAWEHIKNSLIMGDILYFDEAFDLDERKLIVENVLTFGEFEFIGASMTSLALKVVSIHKI